MNKWIFSSSSFVFRTMEIVDWWRLGKERFPFNLIGQGKGAIGKEVLKESHSLALIDQLGLGLLLVLPLEKDL